MQQLPKEEHVLVAGQTEAGVGREAGVGAVGPPRAAQTGRVLGHLVQPRGEVRQGEHAGAHAQNEDAHAQVAGLEPEAPEVGDGDDAEHGGDVVAAGDRPRLRAADLEALLDARDDDVHEPVHHNALKYTNICLDICIYIYMYVCMYIHAHACISTCTHIKTPVALKWRYENKEISV